MARWFGVKPNELTLTNDSARTGQLQQILLAHLSSRNNALILLVNPTFVMYHFYAQLSGAQIISLRYDSGNEISRGCGDEGAAEISTVVLDCKSQ